MKWLRTRSKTTKKKKITSSFIIITFICFCFKINWTFVLMLWCSLLPFFVLLLLLLLHLQLAIVRNFICRCMCARAYLSRSFHSKIKFYCDGIEQQRAKEKKYKTANGTILLYGSISVWPNPNCYYFNFLFSWSSVIT